MGSAISLLGCSNERSNPKGTGDSIAFNDFFERAKELTLPFRLNIGSDSVYSFTEKAGDTTGSSNRRFKKIDKSDYLYLKAKYPTEKKYLYRTLFKKRVNDDYLLLITQNDVSSDYLYRFLLNSYSSSGNLLDTLAIAGTIGALELSCDIDTSFQITTKSELPSEHAAGKTDSIPVLRVIRMYRIVDGFFIKDKEEMIHGHYYLNEVTGDYQFRKD